MYLGKKQPRRKKGSNPVRVVIFLLLIVAGLYIIAVRPDSIQKRFQPTPTPTRSAASHIEEAESLLAEGKVTEAIEAYEDARIADPTNLDIYIPLARLLIFSARIDEGMDMAETALLIDPDYAPARAIRAMAMDWKSSELVDEGLDEEGEDLLFEAYAEINRAIDDDPILASSHAFQAEILFDLGNFEQADSAISTALEIDSDNLDALRVAGYMDEFRGYRDSAIEYYLQALEVAPNLPMLHHALGRTYIGAGEVDLARQSLETAIRLDPSNAEYLYFMGYAYLAIGERELATEYFNQALEIRSDYPAAHCRLGLIYYQQRNWEGAVPELELGVEGYGDRVTYGNSFCYYTLGLSYFYLARCEDAYPLFDKVLEVIPDNAPSLDGIKLCREAESSPDQ
ncbi:MAG: tetratricopeptide repeat protein [Chloroflexota bacterium]